MLTKVDENVAQKCEYSKSIMQPPKHLPKYFCAALQACLVHVEQENALGMEHKLMAAIKELEADTNFDADRRSDAIKWLRGCDEYQWTLRRLQKFENVLHDVKYFSSSDRLCQV